MKFLSIQDIGAYKISFPLSNYVWDIVIRWGFFEKDTVGKQFVRALDSISANLAEGFRRVSAKDKILFYRYSLGSMQESLDWCEKAKVRRLITDNEYRLISAELQKLPREIYSLIKFTKERIG